MEFRQAKAAPEESEPCPASAEAPEKLNVLSGLGMRPRLRPSGRTCGSNGWRPAVMSTLPPRA